MSETVQTDKELVEAGSELIEFVEIDDAFVNRLESRVGAYKKLILTAYKLTSEPDWVNQSGKFYLQASGCEKIKNPFGISWEHITRRKEERQDEKGNFYIYFFQGTFYSKLLSSRIEVIGKRSSRSAFFGKKGGEILPLSEVDEEDVAMAAMSNMIVNGVSRIIGIRNPTEEQLKSAGLNLEKIQTVKYEGKVSQEESGKGEEAWKMLLELNDGDSEKAREQCLAITSFKSKEGKTVQGKRDPRDLSGKWLDNTVRKAKELHEKRFGVKSPATEQIDPSKSDSKPLAGEQSASGGQEGGKAQIVAFLALCSDIKSVVKEKAYSQVLGHSGYEEASQIKQLDAQKKTIMALLQFMQPDAKKAILTAHKDYLKTIGIEV